MSPPRGVREVVVPADPGRRGSHVVRTDPPGDHPLPTFVATDGSTRARIRTHLDGEYAVRIFGEPEPFARWQVHAERASTAPLVRRTGRRLTDEAGEPFLWLADTWWFALCDRVSEPELRALARLRADQGFSVVQVVAGLFPEVEAYEDLGELGGRWPWTPGLREIESRWWDDADRRLTLIIEAGLTPAVVGAWSYYLLDLGPERMRQHWHEVIARWAAFPVVWCVAGEAGLPHYRELDEPGLDNAVGKLSAGW